MKTPLILPVCLCLLLAATPAGAADTLVAEGATLVRLGTGYQFTEGPSTDRDGNVFFTDQPNDRILRWDASSGTISDWLKPAGRSNGTYFDRSGNLIACADEENQLWSIAPDHQVTVLLKDFEGKRLNGPNDLWIRPDGGIYFTDPLYKRPYWKRDPGMQQDGQHVYFLPSERQGLRRVATDLRQPNGIIGTPDGQTLYVADIGAAKTYAYRIEPDGGLTEKRLFCEMGSDGMTLDAEGHVYLTGRGVTVYGPDGAQRERITVPEPWTANVTFGGQNRDLLFITAGRSVFGLKMRVRGAR